MLICTTRLLQVHGDGVGVVYRSNGGAGGGAAAAAAAAGGATSSASSMLPNATAECHGAAVVAAVVAASTGEVAMTGGGGGGDMDDSDLGLPPDFYQFLKVAAAAAMLTRFEATHQVRPQLYRPEVATSSF